MKKSLFGGEPIYTEWKEEWTLKMEEFDRQTEHCLYLMHSMEIDDIRQVRVSMLSYSQRHVEYLTSYLFHVPTMPIKIHAHVNMVFVDHCVFGTFDGGYPRN